MAQLRSHVITEPITVNKAVCFDLSGLSHGLFLKPQQCCHSHLETKTEIVQGYFSKEKEDILAERETDSARLGQEEVSEALREQSLRKHSFSGSCRFSFKSEPLIKFCVLGSSLTPSTGPGYWASKRQNIHYTHIQKYLLNMPEIPTIKDSVLLFFFFSPPGTVRRQMFK